MPESLEVQDCGMKYAGGYQRTNKNTMDPIIKSGILVCKTATRIADEIHMRTVGVPPKFELKNS